MALNRNNSPMLIGVPFERVPDDSRRIIHASLTASDQLDSGVVSGSTTGVTYTDDGIDNAGTAWVKWTPSAGDVALLNKSAHIHLEVEADFLAVDITATSVRLLTLAAGPMKFYVAVDNAFYNSLDGSNLRLEQWLELTDRPRSHMVFDFVFDQSNMSTFVDGLLLNKKTITTAPDFTTINLFASQLGTEIFPGGFRFRNFYVTTGPHFQLKHPALTNLNLFGDSISQAGNLPAAFANSNGIAGSDAFKDIGMTAEIISHFGSLGMDVKVTNHAVSGYHIADVQTIVDGLTHLAGYTVCINIGANDVKDSGVLSATFKTDYQALIDSIAALGADHIFIWTVASFAEDAVFATAENKADIDAANVIIHELETENSNVSLVDIFTLFGGHSPDLSLYVTDDLHFSQAGSQLSGAAEADAIAAHYGIA